MRSRLPTLLAAAALLSTGCARCGRPAAAPPERWLPASAPAVVVPRLADAAVELGGLLRALLSVPAAAGLAEPYAALRQQLGIDPLDPSGLAEAGLDPDRGAALSGPAPFLAVLPVADPPRWDAFLSRLARDRLGAGHRAEENLGPAVVVTFRGAPGGPPALSYALVGRVALLAAGAEGAAAVARAAARPEEEALAGSAAYAAARRALGDGLSALAFAPPGAPLLSPFPPARDGAALGLRVQAPGLELRAALLLPPERELAWREVAGGDRAGAAGREESALLPADAFGALRLGGHPAALGRRLPQPLPAPLAARLERAHLDLRRDLLDHLAPGAALGLSLAPTFEVAAVARGVDPGADPFRLVHLSGAARVRDPAGLRDALDRAARARAPRAGSPPAVSARPRPDGTPAWRVALGGGVVELALSGDRLLLAGGAGRLDALLSGAGGWTAPSPEAGEAMASGAAAAAVDFAALVRSLRALPPEAFGTGPDGFVLRALADRFIDPASRLRLAWARLRVLPGAARADLSVEALPP